VTARLDGVDFKPKREALLLSKVAGAVIETLKEKTSNRFCISAPQEGTPVTADRELMTTALAQILENAVKYSVPESPIHIEITAKDSEIILTYKTRDW
jgi:K+-sensing histidine kinase KdpD